MASRLLVATRVALVGVWCVWACGPRVHQEVETATEVVTTTAPWDGSTSAEGVTTLDSGVATSSTTTPTASAGETSPGVTFIDTSDAGGSSLMCDLERQDCERGFKCMPYDASGQGWWNATGCFPVQPDPVGLGEPCQSEGGPWSGHDDCGWAAVCWPDGGERSGYCKGLCVNDRVARWAPCEDPEAVPNWGCQSCFCACELPCNPLVQDCPGDLMCVVTSSIATCVPDASGDGGHAGDPCEYVNTCAPGLVCVNAAAVPGCEGASGCCTPYCNTSELDPCPAETSCAPFYEGGGAPSGLEDVGICISM